jgi:hypothetical protein
MPAHGYEVTRSHLGQHDPGRQDERRDGASAPGRQPVRRIGRRPTRGRFEWRATADPPSRRQRLGNASTAGWAGSRSNAIAARASLPLDAIRQPRDAPIWKLEAALKCRSCRKGRYPTSIDVPRKGLAYHWARDKPWSLNGSNFETTYSRSTPWRNETARVSVNRKYFDNEEAALFEIARQLKDHHSTLGRRDRRSRPGKCQREAAAGECRLMLAGLRPVTENQRCTNEPVT